MLYYILIKTKGGNILNKHIISVKPIVPIKLYIYACSYDNHFKTYDYTTYTSLETILNETKTTIQNASAFLSQCPLVMQEYCKQLKENEEEKKDQKERIKECKQEQKQYIKPLGTTHYIIDTAF